MTWLPRNALLGVVHLPPLPGGPRDGPSLHAIIERAVREAQCLVQSGFDGVVVENFGDVPFFGEQVEVHTAVAMGLVVRAVVQAVGPTVGVNVLRNDARAGLAVASMAEARFVRVNVHSGVYATDQGVLTGQAAETLRYRSRLGGEVAVFADVHVKHATPISSPDLAAAARDTAYRGLADALIVTGPATGQAADLGHAACVKSAVANRPVLIGSGATVDNVGKVLDVADGVIVGTDLKRDGKTEAELDPDRVAAFVRAARR